MKGLILKDLYMLWGYCKALLIVAAVFMLVSFAGNDSVFFTVYPGIIAGMLPMTLLSYDEMERFCSAALPVTRKQYVSAKYLIGLGAGGGAVLVVTVSQMLRVFFNDGHWSDLFPMLLFLAGMSLLAPAVMLPFAFRLGTQKGRLAYYIVIGGSVAGSMIASDTGAFSGTNDLNMLIFFAAAAAVYALSWFLSVRFYNRREL